MKKIKAFFYIFYNSLTSTSYYKDILETNFSFSIKYLASMALMATVITTSVISVKTIPQINKFIYQQKTNLINLYPQDLEITVKDNKWDINKPQPYTIKTPEAWINGDTSVPQNLIIFDQKGTINDFESRNTFVLVNEKNILVKGENKLEVRPLNELPNGTLTKTLFADTINQFDKIIKYIPLFFVVFTALFMYLYYFVFRLIYLFVVALMLVIVNIFIKPDVEFKDLYRIGLHSMTVPFCIDMGLRVAGVVDNSGIPWFFILNIVIAILVMVNAAKIND